jgi:ABC-2 type transport system permease protein
LVLVLALTLTEVVVLLLVGTVLFGMPLPDAGHWVTFLWLYVLSVIACSLLGIAASALVRHARTAGAILNFEAGGSWEPGRTALVLGAWCVIGLVLCLVTFRWTNRQDG